MTTATRWVLALATLWLLHGGPRPLAQQDPATSPGPASPTELPSPQTNGATGGCLA